MIGTLAYVHGQGNTRRSLRTRQFLRLQTLERNVVGRPRYEIERAFMASAPPLSGVDVAVPGNVRQKMELGIAQPCTYLRRRRGGPRGRGGPRRRRRRRRQM